MALPDPLPDDPRKWEGWRSYSSNDAYERLGLSIQERPTHAAIEDHCRRLLVWWQKKLPLKNQPSNPLYQLLRNGLDDAPMYLSEARAILLNPETRSEHDAMLVEQYRGTVVSELNKYLDFALSDGHLLKASDEHRLREYGLSNGLDEDEVGRVIEDALVRTSSQRAPDPPPAASGEAVAASDPVSEFKRMLRLTGLGPDDLTDDQRDAFVNMAENMGLEASDAEDYIDEFLEEMEDGMAAPPKPQFAARQTVQPSTSPVTTPALKMAAGMLPQVRTTSSSANPRLTNRVAPRFTTRIQKGTERVVLGNQKVPEADPEAERAAFPPFINSLGAHMLLIPTGSFAMGSTAPGAGANESPLTKVHVSRYYISKHPVTNAQYEAFDPSHRSKRLATAGDDHPVVHVSSVDAIKFAQWLSAQERKRYRLPTEAEWEYAARGPDSLTYPWGEHDAGVLANFADVNTAFAWSDSSIDDGYSETSPVGIFPQGASPFAIEDMAGNVWEWCLDFFESYKGGERVNPRGPANGVRRVYRGGSWRSRWHSLRMSTRSSNIPNFSCNDVGFRLVCEID